MWKNTSYLLDVLRAQHAAMNMFIQGSKHLILNVCKMNLSLMTQHTQLHLK